MTDADREFVQKHPNIMKLAKRITELEKATGKDVMGALTTALILAAPDITEDK